MRTESGARRESRSRFRFGREAALSRSPVEAALEAGDNSSQVLLEFARSIERVQEVAVVDASVTRAAGAVAVDLSLDQVAKNDADGHRTSGGAEVCPHVVRDTHARHVVTRLVLGP